MATETPTKLDIWGLTRLVLCTVGGALASRGDFDISEGEIEGVAGAVIALASICWGIYVRWNARGVPLEVAMRPEIPVKSDLTGKISRGAGVPT
jgi:hypothetical protein